MSKTTESSSIAQSKRSISLEFLVLDFTRQIIYYLIINFYLTVQSHSRDMGSIEDTDYVVLHQTKLRIQQEIYDWIDYARYGEIPPLPSQ